MLKAEVIVARPVTDDSFTTMNNLADTLFTTHRIQETARASAGYLLLAPPVLQNNPHRADIEELASEITNAAPPSLFEPIRYRAHAVSAPGRNHRNVFNIRARNSRQVAEEGQAITNVMSRHYGPFQFHASREGDVPVSLLAKGMHIPNIGSNKTTVECNPAVIVYRTGLAEIAIKSLIRPE